MAGLQLPSYMQPPVAPGSQWTSQDEALEMDARRRALTMPMFVTSPTGAVYRGSTGGTWDPVGNVSVDALGSVGRGSGSGRGDMDPEIRSRMLAMIDQLNSPVGLPPGPASYAPRYEEEAERAALTASKERAGQRLRASIKGLDSMMSRRGITGSGIQGRGLAELVNANQSEQAGTDRQIIQNRTSRARAVDDANFQAQLQYNTQVGQMQMADKQRLTQLLSAYGMFY